MKGAASNHGEMSPVVSATGPPAGTSARITRAPSTATMWVPATLGSFAPTTFVNFGPPEPSDRAAPTAGTSEYVPAVSILKPVG